MAKPSNIHPILTPVTVTGKIKLTPLNNKIIFFFIGGLLFFSLTSLAQTYGWMQKADLRYDEINVPEPTPRSGAVGFSIGYKGYIGTGLHPNDYSNLKDFWEYNPAANTWTQKADFGGTARH
jgi:hypothetical protein